ncbi:ATP-binding protein [Nocardioides sp. BP30]|uniref:ATP-binding protein n=1 Tax=Nocardioides sp. BP30 TaxID=3036374 RepID=UPI00246928F7|nr:ATP-binding protein [Nocardioides sp. BP30]WGL52134.1 ATP-binding protein [Nocardioides sp. BP30]
MELVLLGERPLAQAALLNFNSDPDHLVIDAARLTFACPLDLAGIVATANWAAAASMPVTLKMPVDPNAASYLQRMDVIQLMPPRIDLVGRMPVDARTDLRNRLLEVTPINPSNVDSVQERLGRLIDAFYAEHSVAAGRRVSTACGELLDNAVTHGSSPTGAFIAAQTYTGTTTEGPRFEVAVCDTGIGVRAHLRNNPRYRLIPHDRAALSTALKAGTSGVGDDRGNGLSDLVSRTRHHGDLRFEMRSGHAEITVVGSPTHCEQKTLDRQDETAGTWAWLSHWIAPSE